MAFLFSAWFQVLRKEASIENSPVKSISLQEVIGNWQNIFCDSRGVIVGTNTFAIFRHPSWLLPIVLFWCQLINSWGPLGRRNDPKLRYQIILVGKQSLASHQIIIQAQPIVKLILENWTSPIMHWGWKVALPNFLNYLSDW